MFNWLRELYEIRDMRRERDLYCASCEVLKVELAAERREKEKLLAHILHPATEAAPIQNEEKEPIRPQHVPWRVKQQELETRDREEAQRIMNQFRNRKPVDTEKLEKEMNING